MKKLLKEIALIVIMASAIAVAYNLFSPKPLPWIYKRKVIPLVHDTELIPMTAHTSVSSTDSISVKDTLPTSSNIPDTLKAEKDTVKQDLLAEKQSVDEKNTEIEEESTGNKLKTLNYKQVLKVKNNPEFLLIDARHPEEWKEEHIGNAINIEPPYEGNTDEYFKKLMSVPQDKIIVVYCTGGSCDASHKVASDLMSLGYKRVFLYAGGWDDWTKNGKGK